MSRRFATGVTLLVFVLFLKGVVGQAKPPISGYLLYEKKAISSGDLLFRQGTGFFSQYFMNAGARPSPYSHVGLVANHHGKLVVLHAEASELTGRGLVKSEPLEIFLSHENALAAAVYRVAATNTQRQKAVGYALEAYERKIPFDTAFDIGDQSRVYCTELIWRAYQAAGLNLVLVMDDATVGSVKKKIVSINNILESAGVYSVQTIKGR